MQHSRKTYRNVFAAFGPGEGERVIVGAHYHAAGPLPGADDNASGVAGLIDLARLLAKPPPRLRVELVAYAQEEPTLLRDASHEERRARPVAQGAGRSPPAT